VSRDAIFQSLVIAAILGIVAHVRDYVIFKTRLEPLAEWWKQTSMDALKISVNPISERLMELADRYIASVTGAGKITTAEKQELIDGLQEIMNDPGQVHSKRQSASMSLRFIEQREGLTAKRAANNH
jgi:hypothetical protein